VSHGFKVAAENNKRFISSNTNHYNYADNYTDLAERHTEL